MTTLELKLDLPTRIAREAKAAGLLTPESIQHLLQEALRRRAGENLVAAARRTQKYGGTPLTEEDFVAEFKTLRKARKAAKSAQ